MSNKEIRVYNLQASEVKEDIAFGYAAIFNSMSEEMWGFTEVIDPGAFDNTDMSDVRALFNHDNNLLLARTASGTLDLQLDENGLKYEFVIPQTSYGKDLIELMKRGDVTQSSFGFTIASGGEYWVEESGKLPVRHITKIDRLFDVSPVTYPAYVNTTVAVRSLENFRKNNEIDFSIYEKELTLKSKLLKNDN